MGKEKKKKELLGSLPDVFRTVQRTQNLPPGDFPDINKFHAILSDQDFTTFPKISGSRMKNGKMFQGLEAALTAEIPNLMRAMKGGTTAGFGTAPAAPVQRIEDPFAN